MSEKIEGLFIKSTKIKHNLFIVDLLTLTHGRCSFTFYFNKKKSSSFIFQPFHFIEFSSGFNLEKKVNKGNNPALVFPVINIISDVRKTGYAMLLTEIIHKLISNQEANPKLYLTIKQMILYFEHQPFNPVFGVFFIKELLPLFGIQPINNYNSENLYFNVEEGKFTLEEEVLEIGDFPNKAFHLLLGTKIDDVFSLNLSTSNRRLIMGKLLDYMQYHDLINKSKIKSIHILQSIYD